VFVLHVVVVVGVVVSGVSDGAMSLVVGTPSVGVGVGGWWWEHPASNKLALKLAMPTPLKHVAMLAISISYPVADTKRRAERHQRPRDYRRGDHVGSLSTSPGM
jgi:hypothetical protein